ncbi:transaldolase family protein [Pseudomonas bohemica]|uniref:transaldolase family protein n=1 Tax=Pseudomonas bohemica TaxID=2044872 RepID=UPI000DA5FDAB|nr:transaldolase family protein [Pseudomonas bohemica]
MEVPDFVRLLKQQNMDSEVWWDSSPSVYASFKNNMHSHYGDIIDSLSSHLCDSPLGITGATTNPRLVTQAILKTPQLWRRYIAQLPLGFSDNDKARQVYDQMIAEGARLLHPLWVSSQGRHGWLSAQIEGGENMGEDALVARGLKLASLAPNLMIKVPGSEQGYRAIEQLVAQGCSINNTFCFTVSQAATYLKAIHDGQLRAQVQGVNTEGARYVISFMIGRLGAQSEFAEQAVHRRLNLTGADRRWAEIAVYQAMQALLRRSQTSVRLLLCSVKIDTDAHGREHCWHLQRTGADTTLYTLTPQLFEFLIRRQQDGQPIKPASGWVQMPKRVLNRLTAIPYFNQAYFQGDLAPSDFASHAAFVTASLDARAGHERLLGFVKSSTGGANLSSLPPLSQFAKEHVS